MLSRVRTSQFGPFSGSYCAFQVAFDRVLVVVPLHVNSIDNAWATLPLHDASHGNQLTTELRSGSQVPALRPPAAQVQP